MSDLDLRREQRRSATRQRLLDAALQLSAQRGTESLSLRVLTREAQLGFGAFYNYFPSIEALLAALTDELYGALARDIAAQTESLDDPAACLALTVRHVLARGQGDPAWSAYLVREGLSDRVLAQGFSSQLLDTLQRGARRGRLRMPDPTLALLSTLGLLQAALSAQTQAQAAGAAWSALVRTRELDSGDLPTRAAASLLLSLGLEAGEAEALASDPWASTPAR